MDLSRDFFSNTAPDSPPAPSAFPPPREGAESAQSDYDTVLHQINAILEDSALSDEECLKKIEQLAIDFQQRNSPF